MKHQFYFCAWNWTVGSHGRSFANIWKDLHISRGSHGASCENVNGDGIAKNANDDDKRDEDALNPEAGQVPEVRLPWAVRRPETKSVVLSQTIQKTCVIHNHLHYSTVCIVFFSLTLSLSYQRQQYNEPLSLLYCSTRNSLFSSQCFCIVWRIGNAEIKPVLPLIVIISRRLRRLLLLLPWKNKKRMS